jgi:ribonucleoside-diphosphate reductase beta chain
VSTSSRSPQAEAFSYLAPFVPSFSFNSVASYFSNELNSHDEGLHCDFTCLLRNSLVYPATPARPPARPPASTIRMTICDGVNSEYQFVHDAIPFHLLGMNAGLVYQYIDFCAYRLMLVTLQY